MELIQSQKIVSQFFPKGKVIQIKESDKGLINQTFIVWVENNFTLKKYILQSVNTAIFQNYKLTLENIIEVKKAITESSFSYSFPTPIDNRYINISSQVWRLIPFVEQSICFEKITNKKLAFEASVCLGSFYYVLHNFDTDKLHETLPDFHNANKRYNQLEDAITSAEEERKINAFHLIENIKKEKEVLIKFDILNKVLPKRVCHFDTKISNFLFDKETNKAKALIDLDTLMPGTILSDIGDMIRTYSNPLGEESSDLDNIKADKEIVNLIIRGFLKSSEEILNQNEKLNLIFAGKAITLMQSVRFLTDYLNNDVYYKTTYKDQNWVRAQNQWYLYCSLKNI